MRAVDIIGAFLTGLLAVAALSLIVKPGYQLPQVVSAFGKAVSDDIGAAKA